MIFKYSYKVVLKMHVTILRYVNISAQFYLDIHPDLTYLSVYKNRGYQVVLKLDLLPKF